MRKPHILVCDDQVGIRNALRLILESSYTLDFGQDGREAVDYLRNKEADLLIMDIKMPQKNGIEALTEIKKMKPRQKILIITGYESYDVASEAIRAGANDYLTKPFEREMVQQKVAELLSIV